MSKSSKDRHGNSCRCSDCDIWKWQRIHGFQEEKRPLVCGTSRPPRRSRKQLDEILEWFKAAIRRS